MKLVKKILQVVLAAAMILAGANHFFNPEFYLRMMPPVLPAPSMLNYLSGAIEIFLGVTLLIPKFTRFAAWGLIALFIAVYPANIYMATHPEFFPEFSLTALYLRLPFQLIFIAWAFWFTRRSSEN